MLQEEILYNNIDYKLIIEHGDSEIDLTPDIDIKYDLKVNVRKSLSLAADNFTLTINNLPKYITDKINKPRLRSSTLTQVKLYVKGNADNVYASMINKDAIEIITRMEDNSTTPQTTMYGFSGSGLFNAVSNVNLHNIAFTDLLKKFANDTGMTFKSIVSDIETKDGFYTSGNDTIGNHLAKLEQSANDAGADLFADNKELTLLARKKAVGNTHQVTDANLRKTPSLQANILTLEMFLYPAISVGNLVQINKNVTSPIMGTYKVLSVTHDLDYKMNGNTTGRTMVELIIFSF